MVSFLNVYEHPFIINILFIVHTYLLLCKIIKWILNLNTLLNNFYLVIRLDIRYHDFLFCLTHALHRILDLFFAKRTDWYSEAIRILKTDMNLSSSLRTWDKLSYIIDFLILTSSLYLKYDNILLYLSILGILGDDIEYVRKSI